MWIRVTLLLALGSRACATNQMKIYAAGSGSNMMSQPETVQEIIELSGNDSPNLLYVGTAAYDNPNSENTQTAAFIEAGVNVTAINVAWLTPSMESMVALFADVDIVLVSGGNTLFARDRWHTLGVDVMMKDAMHKGAVMCGGSAGGIVWFDGGHSDSMEMSSFKNPPGPFFDPNMGDEGYSNWAYIRVPGLSFVPGFFCPHYDEVESNGVPRETDFTAQLQQHSGEIGIGVDNWAALMINGENFTMISRQGKSGSVSADGTFTPAGDGTPGVWQLAVGSTGTLTRALVAGSGAVSDLLFPARYIVQSNMLEVARGQNPDDGVPAAWASKAAKF